MNFIASLEPHVVMYILSSISEGLTALGKILTARSFKPGGIAAVVTFAHVLVVQIRWCARAAAPVWTT